MHNVERIKSVYKYHHTAYARAMYLVNLMVMQFPTTENLARVSRFICLVGVLQDSAWLLIM